MREHVCLKITCVNNARIGLKPGRQNKPAEGREAQNEEVTGGVEVHVLEGKKRPEKE